MANIVGGIAVSHTPTIGFAVDGKKEQDPVWKPIFEAFEPAKAWLEEKKPDALVVIYNDHVTSFFFDHYSAFALGTGASYGVADEGGGARNLPPINGHAALAQHIGHSLMADEFDMSFFQEKKLDHGFFSPMSLLCKKRCGVQLIASQRTSRSLSLPLVVCRIKCMASVAALTIRRGIESS